jgi:hypothetical protein
MLLATPAAVLLALPTMGLARNDHNISEEWKITGRKGSKRPASPTSGF